MKNIKAILLDSGRVLNSPASGHWFMTQHFFQIVDSNRYSKVKRDVISHAFDEANHYIQQQKLITDADDEYRHFIKFYRIFADSVPELGLTTQQVEALASELVHNAAKYTFYADALDVIPRLKERYKLAVVSDAWPSLLDVFAHQKMDQYFDCFVISSMIGVAKPDEKMYTAALEKLGIAAGEAIFVDDNPDNCMGAQKVGIRSFLLCRNQQAYLWNRLCSIGKGYGMIRSLYELERML